MWPALLGFSVIAGTQPSCTIVYNDCRWGISYLHPLYTIVSEALIPGMTKKPTRNRGTGRSILHLWGLGYNSHLLYIGRRRVSKS